MIINIRGTSGSGKSTLVRALMAQYTDRQPYHLSGRRQPIGYVCTRPEHKPLAVVGHYETACGGCDTIPTMDKIFELVRQSHRRGWNVVFEGLLISADAKRTLDLHKGQGLPLTVIGLNKVPIEMCLESVNKRRMERMGPEKFTPVKEKNTISKHRGVDKSMEFLIKHGVTVHSCDRDEALALCESLLDLT